jgi:hypothetical protein
MWATLVIKKIENFCDIYSFFNALVTELPQYTFMARYLVNHRDNFTFILVTQQYPSPVRYAYDQMVGWRHEDVLVEWSLWPRH